MKTAWRTLVCVALLALAGCIPLTLNPTVSAAPGANKTPQAFAADQVACKQVADQQIAGAKSEIVGQIHEAIVAENEGGPMVPDSAVVGAMATLQQPYDAAYAQCMYARGNQVPGYVVAATVVPQPSPPPVRYRRRARHHEQHRARATTEKPAESAAATQPAPAAFVESPPAK